MKNIFNKTTYILLFTVLILGILYLNSLMLSKLPSAERGTIGDVFGLSNAIFSGLGIVGIVYTLYMQIIDSQNTKYQQRKNEEMFLEQQRSIETQILDNYFFNLLMRYNTVIENLNYRNFKGSQVVQKIVEQRMELMHSRHKNEKELNESLLIDEFRSFSFEEKGISSMLINAFHVIAGFIDSTQIPDEKKVQFREVLNKTIPREQIFLLYYTFKSIKQDNEEIDDFLEPIANTEIFMLFNKEWVLNYNPKFFVF